MFTEENDRRPHVPTAADLRAQERASRPSPSGYFGYTPKLPKYDYYPSGRLVLRTGHSEYGSTTLVNDRKRWTFESRLPLVFEKIEKLTAEVEHRQAEAERQARERKRAWQAAVETARRQWAENCRHAHLDNLLARRRRRLELEELLAELRAAHRPRPGSPAGAWLQWISDVAPTASVSLRDHSSHPRSRNQQTTIFKNCSAPVGALTVPTAACRTACGGAPRWLDGSYVRSTGPQQIYRKIRIRH